MVSLEANQLGNEKMETTERSRRTTRTTFASKQEAVVVHSQRPIGWQKKFNCDYKHKLANYNSCDLWRKVASKVVVILVCQLLLLLGSNGGNQICCQQLANSSTGPNIIIIDQQPAINLLDQNSNNASSNKLPAHFQPASVFLAQNKSINFTHLTLDELTGSLYVGATNWLFQLASGSLRLETALQTGPHLSGGLQGQQLQQVASTTGESPLNPNSANTNNNLINPSNNLARDCSPGECQAQLTHVQELELIPASHAHHTSDLRSGQPLRRPHQHHSLHTLGANSTGYGQRRPIGQQVTPTSKATGQQQAAQGFNQQQANNNYNKLLAIDYAARQLIVCGSLNQGACRRHQLGRLANFSDLIPLPVVPNDEQSSSVGLVVSGAPTGGSTTSGSIGRPGGSSVFYVAATNSRLGPYRELVPAISARYLDSAGGRAMQIIERSFTDTARVDISSELRDYYLVNYLHSFQHNDFIYFATQQRRSPLRQLEESGYVTRLGRLCLSDLSFQSYVEMTLECTDQRQVDLGRQQANRNNNNNNNNNKQQSINYNLLQDAHLMSAGSHLQQQLGLTRSSSTLFVGSFAQSKDHTTKTTTSSAICMFPMDKIEQRFNENIKLCFNGTSKSRNMNYIAGSVNDCPRLKSANSQLNVCSEPVKLNGSLSVRVEPVITFDNELITSLTSTVAPTSPLNLRGQRPQHQQQHAQQRQHQVLLAGTSEGALKKIVLVSEDRWPHQLRVRGLEFDSIQVDDAKQTILADMHLVPSTNPQLLGDSSNHQPANRLQYVIAATAHKIVKLPVNTCKAPRRPPARANATSLSANLHLVDDCLACAQLQDPFCGWCASSGACVSRDECQQRSSQGASAGSDANKLTVHWTPFDSIKCSYYKPIWPQFVPMEAELGRQLVEVNIKLARQQLANANQLSTQLAHTQFACHFDYSEVHSNRHLSSNQSQSAGATTTTTKAGQARVNWDAGTVTVGCPLAARPRDLFIEEDSSTVKLSVRMLQTSRPEAEADQEARHLLQDSLPIERELTMYQCSRHQDCGACLTAGQSGKRWSCSWCPLSQRCTFNASHPDLGCAASAIGTTAATTTASSSTIRGSHLSGSLDTAQANMLGVSVNRLEQCPSLVGPSRGQQTDQSEPTASSEPLLQVKQTSRGHQQEILVPNGVRRAIQVQLRQSIGSNQAAAAKRVLRIECLIEFEGVKARFSARLLDNLNVLCQEQSFNYLAEVATLRAQLSVILNDNQVIETTEVILYKCHLFGVNPPALTSSFGAPGSGLQVQSSASSWRAHELADLMEQSGQPTNLGRQSDCSLCANVDRKYQCAWCSDTCSSAELCQQMPASNCPPPRIDSIRPNSGPIEGGTLLTIEGSNLGSNEREIQDKISVGGEPCQLIMYSVSTRIVCKTGPSLVGAQAATVFVGNRAGVSSAYDKFHYKAVHLSDVNPKIGPVSGGTRLFLTGSNLNVGSRLQINLDDNPCTVDASSYEFATSNQITCVTGPNLLATGSSRNISRLTLTIDNSTHHLPYPFAYQPDPIITNIEPAESFVSGGRLLLISGHHLASPQTVKLLVYHEHLGRHNILNGTTCITQNDTLITCLTPALSREMLANLHQLTGSDDNNNPANDIMSYESSNAGLRLKMMLVMDDVKSVRNLDEYYHHLPHYLAYFEDPQLFRLSSQVIDFTGTGQELIIAGENLKMRQLDQDMLITVGNQNVCVIKSIQTNQVVCELPSKVAPVYDDSDRLLERPLLPIVGLIGANLRYPIGHMQYTSQQYQLPNNYQAGHLNQDNNHQHRHHQQYQSSGGQHHQYLTGIGQQIAAATSASGSGQVGNVSILNMVLVMLSVVGFVGAFSATFVFALARFRQSKAEQEYKRIQLQMGSLDVNGQPVTPAANGHLFDKIHFQSNNSRANNNLLLQQTNGGLVDYVGGALSGKKLFYQLNQPQVAGTYQHQLAASPLTDVSSLVGSSPAHNNAHLVRLSSNGTIINTTTNQNNQIQQNRSYYSALEASQSGSSQQSSPNSARNNSPTGQPLVDSNNKTGLLAGQRQRQPMSCSRNFNWTQEAPSTIVPYAVIEACNLTLEGKNAIRDYI